MKEDIKCIKTFKENFENKLLQQSDEIIELTEKLKRETELVMKLKISSKENQDEITRLDKLRKLLETRAEEKESTISCMKEDIKAIEILKEDFNKQLLEQTNKLKTEIDSGNKLKILLRKIKDEISRLNKVVDELNNNNISNNNNINNNNNNKRKNTSSTTTKTSSTSTSTTRKRSTRLVEANNTTVITYANATATDVLQQQQQQDKSSTILYSRSTSDNKSSIRNYNDTLNKLNPLLLKVIVGTRLAIH